MKRRGDEIERKTRDIDGLNRKYERVVAAQPGEQDVKVLRACQGLGKAHKQAEHAASTRSRQLVGVMHGRGPPLNHAEEHLPPRTSAHLSFACTIPQRRAEAVNTGPLEATISSLTREIEAKGSEGRDLQRRWISKQTELVALQVWGLIPLH